MLTNNAQQFKSFLLERNMDLNFIDDNGESVIEIREMLKCGAKIRLVTVFDKDDTSVNIYGFDYIQGINPVKKSYIYEALNNLNSNYTFTKYYLDGDSIIIQGNLYFLDTFSNEATMQMMLGVMDCANSEYPALMKLNWS